METFKSIISDYDLDIRDFTSDEIKSIMDEIVTEKTRAQNGLLTEDGYSSKLIQVMRRKMDIEYELSKSGKSLDSISNDDYQNLIKSHG